MRPPYTYLYPQKALTEVEGPSLFGQRSPVRPAGDTRDGALIWPTTGTWPGLNNGFGSLLVIPALVGGYTASWLCENGYLEASDCDKVGLAPGKEMPGSCPDAFRVNGTCRCPEGSETPDGGCAYQPGYTVDAAGALPIGGSSPTTATEASGAPFPWWVGAAAFVGGGILLYQATRKR